MRIVGRGLRELLTYSPKLLIGWALEAQRQMSDLRNTRPRFTRRVTADTQTLSNCNAERFKLEERFDR